MGASSHLNFFSLLQRLYRLYLHPETAKLNRYISVLYGPKEVLAAEKAAGPLGLITPTYTLVTPGFPLQNSSQRAPLISTLGKAAAKITEVYPWLAG